MQPLPPTPAPAPRSGLPNWVVVLLVALGLFFLLAPILAFLGIYGVRKYIAAAKQAEARNSLSQIAKDAVAAYEAQPAGAAGGAHALCASASLSVPDGARYIRGAKYQSAPQDWSVDAPRHAGFACLGFSLDHPQYYMYSYRASGRGAGASFEAMANGDLNGDDVLSTFAVGGHVQPGGELQVDPQIAEILPGE
jgi:type IV pilus assembly protein PilA